MKKSTVLALLLISYCLSFGQDTKIKHELFTCKARSNYEIIKQDSVGITLTFSSTIDGLPVLNTISIKKANINPESNNINDISDMAKFERFSFIEFITNTTTLSGVSEINEHRIFYSLTETEYFADNRKTKLIGYKFENNNYILEKGSIYSINFTCELKVNDLKNSVSKQEFKTLDKIKTKQLMIKHINSGDVNKIIETLKIK